MPETNDAPLVEILPPSSRKDTRKLVADAFAIARREGSDPAVAALAAGGTLADITQGGNRLKRLIADKAKQYSATDEELLQHVKQTLAEMSVDGNSEEQKFAAVVALAKVLDGIAKRTTGDGKPAVFSADTLGVLGRVDET